MGGERAGFVGKTSTRLVQGKGEQETLNAEGRPDIGWNSGLKSRSQRPNYGKKRARTNKHVLVRVYSGGK